MELADDGVEVGAGDGGVGGAGLLGELVEGQQPSPHAVDSRSTTCCRSASDTRRWPSPSFRQPWTAGTAGAAELEPRRPRRAGWSWRRVGCGTVGRLLVADWVARRGPPGRVHIGAIRRTARIAGGDDSAQRMDGALPVASHPMDLGIGGRTAAVAAASAGLGAGVPGPRRRRRAGRHLRAGPGASTTAAGHARR